VDARLKSSINKKWNCCVPPYVRSDYSRSYITFFVDIKFFILSFNSAWNAWKCMKYIFFKNRVYETCALSFIEFYNCFCSKRKKLLNKLIFNWINLFCPHLCNARVSTLYRFFKTLFVSRWRYGLQLLQQIFFFQLLSPQNAFHEMVISVLTTGNRGPNLVNGAWGIFIDFGQKVMYVH